MIRQTLGKYSIKKWLGGGQFGDVYLARDTILDMDFALKVSRMRPSDIQMLKEEARLLASMNHPHIVRFYSVDRIDGQFILVAEYVEGTNLRTLLQKGRLDVTHALRIIRQILSALTFAHEKGVVHRDLKPENILLAADGVVKVADFGLARFLKQSSLAVSVAGTPVYMSPEAWGGRFLPVSDLWSVGVLFYEMLTGLLPFKGDNYEEIRKNLMLAKPVPPQRLRPELSKRLNEVILKLLAKSSAERYQNAEEVISALSKRGHSFLSSQAYASTASEGITLSSEQADIVASKQVRLLVIGAAGCGKTTLLVHRANYLIEQGVAEDKLLFLNFTRRAAEEIRLRLEKIQARLMPELWVETMHSFGWRFLRMEGWRIDLSPEFKTVNPTELIGKLAKKWGRNRTKVLIERVSQSKLIGENTEDILTQTPAQRQFADFRHDYQKILKEQDAVDFNDLLIYTVRILENNQDLLEEWRSRFLHILADEAQDFNAIQIRLLRLLCGPETGLFITGDATQSIYQWRGAEPRMLTACERIFVPIKKHHLKSSFRMGRELIKVAGNLMAHSSYPDGIPNFSLKKSPGRFEFYKAKGTVDEAGFVTDRIRTLTEREGYKPSDIGILYRVNSYSRSFEEALAGEKIPYSLIGAQPFYERPEVQHLLALLRSIREKDYSSTKTSWQWLMSLKPETNPLELTEQGLKLSPEAKTRQRKKIELFFADLVKWANRVDELAPVDLIDNIRTAAVAAKRFSLPSVSEAVSELYEAASRFSKGELGLFLDNLELLDDLELAQWSRDAVKLLSIHSSKGLEFKAVFLVGLIEGIFPLTRSLASPESLDEERRLCYVAITRASARLYVSLPSRRFRQPTRPSRFLLELTGLI